MSKKRIPTLSDIVSDETQAFQTDEGPQWALTPEADLAKVRKTAPSAPKPKKIMPEDKKGRASTTVYLPQEVKRQLEEIWFAERQSKSQNDLFLEGLDLVFKQRGMPSVKELVKEEA